jgi:putative tryptophan/tyrosine transport system substrate-binding protein
MNRREVTTLLGGAAAWPLAAHGQQAPKTIGLLGANSASQQSQWTAAFVQRLRELGWTEGRNIAIEARWAEGSNERAAEFAAELVRRGPDLIVTSGTPIALAAKQATATVPIVFATASDPVGSGLVESLPRPGGNVTGLSIQSPDLSGKRLELLRDLIPGLHRVAVMASVGSPAAISEMGDVQAAGKALGLDTATFEVRQTEDFAPTFRAMNGRAHALYVVSDPFFASNRIRIHTLTMSARLPTMHGFREYVEAGGLVCYGASFPHLWRRAGDYADKILRGAKPVDLPVEQPTKFDLVVNLITAQALGLTVPPSLLARADEVIE